MRAVSALKERAMIKQRMYQREEADKDEAAAEALRDAMRDDADPKPK
jgi:hypothetical protein